MTAFRSSPGSEDCAPWRRYFGVADVAQILLDIGFHRRVGIQQPVGRGAVGAQIVHRLEDVRRSVGDDRNAVAACKI
jgi:hypothetical protein